MAFFFGDGFDLYTGVADLIGYWDASSTSGNSGLTTGRFTGSRSFFISPANTLVKTSGSNDAVHHFVFATNYAQNLGGTSSNTYFMLYDGATAQCSVHCRSDGAIALRAGAAGAELAVYTGAVTTRDTWFAFEVEVVIHNTNGSFAVRKNGNPTNDFFLGSLNTRASANNYANGIRITSGTNPTNWIDDFLWRSDATVPWVGDVRCYTRMPLADAAIQWTRSTGTRTTSKGTGGGTSPYNAAHYNTYTIPCDGTITTYQVNYQGAYTGNAKVTMFANNGIGTGAPSTGSAPAAILGSATTRALAAATGYQTFDFPTPIAVTAGQIVWLGFCHDVNAGSFSGPANNGYFGGTNYASFPAAGPVAGISAGNGISSVLYISPSKNAEMVNEAQQDAVTTYVYAPANGLADLYTIAPITITPATVLGVTTRGYLTKSDAGTRNAAVRVKSGATTVQSTSTALTPSGWLWLSRTDTVDPATGTAWTAAGVNGINIGPVTTA